eukprot:TRINITY_DN64271_c0_g1_i1.p1 TRINITY_DN64271_c0_g1~~TRINITY_DN64271_c0_g1_i1.p1  ORF type:complete len:572 (-),score=62.37 TRINITY_DN64271_c0_g1_i1:102-1817(-)
MAEKTQSWDAWAYAADDFWRKDELEDMILRESQRRAGEIHTEFSTRRDINDFLKGPAWAQRCLERAAIKHEADRLNEVCEVNILELKRRKEMNQMQQVSSLELELLDYQSERYDTFFQFSRQQHYGALDIISNDCTVLADDLLALSRLDAWLRVGYLLLVVFWLGISGHSCIRWPHPSPALAESAGDALLAMCLISGLLWLACCEAHCHIKSKRAREAFVNLQHQADFTIDQFLNAWNQLETDFAQRQASFEALVCEAKRALALDLDAAVWLARKQKASAMEELSSLEPYGGIMFQRGCSITSHGRTLASVVNDFRAECPQQVEQINMELQCEHRVKAEKLKNENAALCRAAEAETKCAMSKLRVGLENRSERLRFRMPSAIPHRSEGTVQTPFALALCIRWMGCPDACVLAQAALGVCSEVALLPLHCKTCPATRHCSVCGHAFPPNRSQAHRMERHWHSCAAWPVDGMMFRHFLARYQELPAAGAAVAIQACVRRYDQSSFPGYSARHIAEDQPVCCPHFGCDLAFRGRAEALRHAASCSARSNKPFWSIDELTDRARAQSCARTSRFD